MSGELNEESIADAINLIRSFCDTAAAALDAYDCSGWARFRKMQAINTPTAMSEPQTITRAADDIDFIAKRLKELKAEQEEARRQSDPETASGEHLDRIAADYGERRSNSGESDYMLRQRLLKKVRGE